MAVYLQAARHNGESFHSQTRLITLRSTPVHLPYVTCNGDDLRRLICLNLIDGIDCPTYEIRDNLGL
jgi:hypothetical protein